MATQILLLMTYPHIFFPASKIPSYLSAVYNIQEKHNEELHPAMRTNSDMEVRKGFIFKKYLNVRYLRTFIYSVLRAFDAISKN